MLQRSVALGIVAVGQTLAILAGSLDLSVAYVISLASLVAAETWTARRGTCVPGILAVLARRRRGRPRSTASMITKLRVNAFIATLGIGADHQGLHRQPLRRSGGRHPEMLREAGLHALRHRSRCRCSCSRRSCAVVWFLLRYTRFGYRLYAVGGDEEVSRLSGVRTHRTIIAAHVLCSLCAALTGLFLASRLGSGTPTVGPDGGYDLESIAAVVLGGTALAGGRGGVLGTIGGVFMLAVLDNTFNQLEVNAFLKDVVRGVIIIAAVAVYARRTGKGGTGHEHRRPPPTRFEPPASSRGERLRKALIGTAPIFLVLIVLLVWIAIENPNFLEPPGFLAFLKRAAPLAILAAGQYFVIVSGEFDLSVGSLVTVVVVVAARLIDGDPGKTWPVIALLLAIGVGGRARQRARSPRACGCRRSSRRSACC